MLSSKVNQFQNAHFSEKRSKRSLRNKEYFKANNKQKVSRALTKVPNFYFNKIRFVGTSIIVDECEAFKLKVFTPLLPRKAD